MPKTWCRIPSFVPTAFSTSSSVAPTSRLGCSRRLLAKDAQEHQSNPEEAVFDRLLSDDVLRAIDGLPDDFRMVVVLADLQEFSYKEIAEIMECPVGTVMSRLYRGRRLLQKNLERYAFELGIVKPSIRAAETTAGVEPADLAAYRRRKLAASDDS
jgi:RNA polymerase sigma-70 factor (ECF subfamily)